MEQGIQKYKINFSKIYSVKQMQGIDIDAYYYMMKEGIYLSRKKNAYNYRIRFTNSIQNTAYEKLTTSVTLSRFSDLEKSIYVGYAMFEDDSKFIMFLLRNGYTLEILKQMSSILDKVILHNKIAVRHNQKNAIINSIEAFNTLANKLKQQYGITKIEDAINRINEIIAFKSEVFLELENQFYSGQTKRSIK